MSDTGAITLGSLRSGGQNLGGSRAAPRGPQVTDTDWYANQIRMLRVMAPQLEREPEVLAQLAASPVDAETLARQTASYTGLYTSDQLARQISTLDAPAQRVVWAQLTKPQQTTLTAMGYSPPARERQSGSNPMLGLVGKVAGGMFEGFHKVLSTAIEPALDLVNDIGDIPSELYRTIRQLPPEMQQIALLAAVAGAVAVPFAAPAVAGLFPALAGTGIAAGAASASGLGFGALAGGATGGLVAATVLTPGDNEFFEAWHLANTGEAVFNPESRQRSRRLLGNDPNLESLATSLGFETTYDVAAAFAGVRDADQSRAMQGQIAVIAERAGAQGTPEFQAAYDLLEKMSTQVAFKDAVKTLQAGKISFGRDVANTVGLTPNTMAYDIVSGGFDAAFVLGLDPTIAATKFLRIGRAVRYGVFPDASLLRTGEEAAPYAQRIIEVTTADTAAGRNTRRAFEVIADGMNSNRWEPVMHHLLPSAKRLRGGLATFGANPANKVGAQWTVDDVRHYFESAIGAADMLSGRGASWQKGAIEIPHVGRYTLQLRQAKAWGARQINFLDELNIEKRQLVLIDRLKPEGTQARPRWKAPDIPAREMVEDATGTARSRMADYTPGAVLPTHADAAGISLGGGRIGTLEDIEAGPVLRVVAGTPVIGTAVRQFATIAKTLAEKVPTNRYVAISHGGWRGAGYVDDMRAYTELFRVIGVPGAVRRAWFNTIVDSPSVAARQLAVRSATKTMLDAAGVGASKEGTELMEIFTQKLDQRFLEVTSDMELAPGLKTRNSVFPGAEDAVFLAVPTFRDLRSALTRSTVLDTLLNAANVRPVESAMARIWKPAVLLRLGFIPRAAGDELLAFLGQHGLGAYARTFVQRAAAQDDEDVLVHANVLQQRFVNPVNSLVAGVSGGRIDGIDELGTAWLLRYSQWVRGALRQGWQPEGAYLTKVRDAVLAPHSLRRALFGGVSTEQMRWAREFFEENAGGLMKEVAAGDSGLAATTVHDLQRMAQIDGRGNPLDDIAIRSRRDVYYDADQNSPRYREGVVRRANQAVGNVAFKPGSPVFDYVMHSPGPEVLRDLGPDAAGILGRHVAAGRDASGPMRQLVAFAGHDNLDNVVTFIDNRPADDWFRQYLIDRDLVPRASDTPQSWLARMADNVDAYKKGTGEVRLARTILHHWDSPRTRHYLTLTGASAPEHWKGYREALDDDWSAGLTRAAMQAASDPVYADAWMGSMSSVVGRGAWPVLDPPREGTARFFVPVLDGDAIATMQQSMGRILAEVDESRWVEYLTGILQESSERAGDVILPHSYRVAARVMADVAALPPRHMTAYGIEQADERAVRLTTSAMSDYRTAHDVGRILNRFGLGDDLDVDAAMAGYVDVAAGAGHKTAGPFDDTVGDRVIDYGEGVWGRRISPSHEAVPIPPAHVEMMDADGNPALSVGTVLQARATSFGDEFEARGVAGYWAGHRAQAEAMADEHVLTGRPSGKGGFERVHQWDDSQNGLPREQWGADHFNDKVFDSSGRLLSTRLGEMKVVKGPIVGDIPIGISSDGTITVDMDYMRHDARTGGYLKGESRIKGTGDVGDVDMPPASEPPRPAGSVRLYRRQAPGAKVRSATEVNEAQVAAGMPDWVRMSDDMQARNSVEGRWFTTNRRSAENYPLDGGATVAEGELVYIDLSLADYQRVRALGDQSETVRKLSAARREEVVLPIEHLAAVKKMPGALPPHPEGVLDTLSVQARKALDEFGIDPEDVLDHLDDPVKYATLLTNYVHLALVTKNPNTAMGLALSGAGYPLPTKAERKLARMAGNGRQKQVMWEMIGPALHDKVMAEAGTPLLHRERRRYGILNVNEHEETRVVPTLREQHANNIDKIDLPPVVHLPEEQVKKLTGWDRGVEVGFRKWIGPAIDVIVRKPVAFHNYMQARAAAEGYFATWLPDALFGGLYEHKGRVHRINATRGPDPAEMAYIRSQLTEAQLGAGPEARWAQENLGTSALFGGDGMPSAYTESHWDDIQARIAASDDPAAGDLKHLLDRFTDDPVDFPAPPDGAYRKVVSRLRAQADRPFAPDAVQSEVLRRVGREAGLITHDGTVNDLMAAYFDDIRGNRLLLDQTARRHGLEEGWARASEGMDTLPAWAGVTDERQMAEQLAEEWSRWAPHEKRYQSLLEEQARKNEKLAAQAEDLGVDLPVDDELAELIEMRPFWLDKLADPEITTVGAAQEAYTKMRRHSHTVAQERAIADTIPFVDSDAIRSQFQEYVRNLSPFLFAEDQFIRRWGRTVRIAPDTLRKGQLLMNGLRSAGIVQKDQFGNEVFVYPASATFTEALGKVPFVPTMLPVASMMTGQVKYMLPGLDNYGMPSGSPLLTIPMGFVTNIFPELQPIHDRFTGERGQRAGIVRSLVPTSVMRFYDAVLGNEDSNRKLASAMMSTMQVAEANGWAPPPDASAYQVEEYLDRVRSTARVMLFAQAMAGFVVPASPGLALAGDPDMPGASGSAHSFDALTGLNFTPAGLNPEFIELVHNMGIEEGTMRFLERYPDVTPDDLFNSNLAYSTRLTDVPSGAAIPTHRTAWEFYEDNRDYFTDFEYAGAYLLPPGRTPEEVADRPDSVHADQLAAGLRVRNTPEALYGDLKWAAAAPVYFEALANYQEMSGQPLSTQERDQVDAMWEAQKKDFFQSHPLFAERLQSGDGRIRRKQTIAELRIVLRDPEAPVPWHGPAMAELLTAWDGWQNSRDTLAGSRTARAVRQRDALDRDWTVWVEDYVRRHPEVGTLWGAVLRPESGRYGTGVLKES